MRLTQILPFQNVFLAPAKKDEQTGKSRAAAEPDRGLSGVQVQSVGGRQDPGDDSTPDDRPPAHPGGLDIKV